MKLDELNEPFLPSRGVWLKQPPELCSEDQAFTAGEQKRCYSVWNYGRLTNELEGEDIDPGAPGKHDTNTPTYLIEQLSSEKLLQLIWALYRCKQGFLQLLLCGMESFQRKCRRTKNKKNLTSVAYRRPSCFSRRVGVKVLLFGKIFLLELLDRKQVVGLFITLFTGKPLLMRQKPSKFQYSAHACDVRKENRSHEERWDWVGWGLVQETEDYILHRRFCFFVSSAIICFCRPHICYF